MPLGLTNAPATFQRLINNLLHEKLDSSVMAYLDDILIYTRGDLENHKKEVRKVLEILKQNNVTLNSTKCEFHKKETAFLGTIIMTEGLKMDPGKVRAIQEWKEPTN